MKLEALGLAKPRATVESQQKGPDEKAPSTTIVCKDRLGQREGGQGLPPSRRRGLRGAAHDLQLGRQACRRVPRPPNLYIGAVGGGSGRAHARGATTILKLEDGVWQFLAPFKGRADALACGKLAGIAALRVSKFENDLPTDLAKYGLELPDSTLTLRTKQKAQTLRIGKSQEDRTFVQRDGLGQVWGVSEAELAPVRQDRRRAAGSPRVRALHQRKREAPPLEARRDGDRDHPGSRDAPSQTIETARRGASTATRSRRC